MNDYNYDQPHEVVHERRPFHIDHETCVRRVVAYLCAYQIHCVYTGPEEGGTWQDRYEFLQAAIPFEADQDYEAREVTRKDLLQDDDAIEWYDEDTKKFMRWADVGLPHVTDEPTRVRLFAARLQLVTIYGDDIKLLYELSPGARALVPLLRYE